MLVRVMSHVKVSDASTATASPYANESVARIDILGRSETIEKVMAFIRPRSGLTAMAPTIAKSRPASSPAAAMTAADTIISVYLTLTLSSWGIARDAA